MKREFRVNLTMGEHTRFGQTLNSFWYFNKNLREIAPGLRGFPHNGGEHSCSIGSTNLEELETFLDLYKEEYPVVEEEIKFLKHNLKHAFEEEKKGSVGLRDTLLCFAPYTTWRYLPGPKQFVNPETDATVSEGEAKAEAFKERRAKLLGIMSDKEYERKEI